MGIRFLVIDNCPCPRKAAPFIEQLKQDVPGATLISCYRGDNARSLLHRLGKHTQRELYACYVAHVAGCNPANPAGRSTHELRSDGVAYPSHPAYSKLSWWHIGMDWEDWAVDALIAAAHRRGWEMWRPYPGTSEAHHIGFRSKPKKSRRQFRVMKQGDTGKRVKHLQWRLNVATSRADRKIDTDGAFGPGTEARVKEFQDHHHLIADGVVGRQTNRELKRVVKKRRHK